MKLKPIVSLFFFLMGIYFAGMGVLSLEERSTSLGFFVIALIHFLVLLGILLSKEFVIQIGTYITLLDLIFGILWVLVSFEPASASLTFLAAISLVLITSDEFKNEIKFGY
ncbi:hypothetical protein NF865_03990 [Thermococcus aggregans]|uniref:Uncharacterized protein n=1 Tax=Thermococcus aggregans TaxID=110163 RepID=A0A9E7MZ13_THEAG|nr:hypothetical protein [Thermococcus aggregans]USS41357.1 hypothetical protein NF865_03990 [Thermococcus aggregans]